MPVIRFDPLEGKKCVISNLRISDKIHGDSLRILRSNGISMEDSSFQFDTLDPQIEVSTLGYTLIEIEGMLELL